MSDDSVPKGPSHIAYQVNETEDGKSFFNRVGSAFPHRDGQGFNVLLNAVPVDGRVTLRTPRERLEALEQQSAPQPQQTAQQQQTSPEQPAPQAEKAAAEPER